MATAKAIEIATKIGEKGPIAIRAAKKAIDTGIEKKSLTQGLDVEDECYKLVLNSEDRVEGLIAFAEKRKPIYHGR